VEKFLKGGKNPQERRDAPLTEARVLNQVESRGGYFGEGKRGGNMGNPMVGSLNEGLSDSPSLTSS